MATVTIAVNFMPKNMIAIGTGLIAVSTALLIMASALENMGGMEWNEIAKGLVALGGSLGIMAVGFESYDRNLVRICRYVGGRIRVGHSHPCSQHSRRYELDCYC